VAHNEVRFGDEAQRLPGRIWHRPHHSFDCPAKDIEAVFGFAIGLVVRDISVDEAIEVDRSCRPLVVELLDDCLVLVRRHWSVPHTIWDSRPLDEPVAHASLVLLQEHVTQLGRRVRPGVVERPERDVH
jgi:hypothetical protein